jgi:hypothetical protein
MVLEWPLCWQAARVCIQAAPAPGWQTRWQAVRCRVDDDAVPGLVALIEAAVADGLDITCACACGLSIRPMAGTLAVMPLDAGRSLVTVDAALL